MRLNDSYYRYIKAFLNTSLITFLKFSLVLTKASLLYLMLVDLVLHMPRLSFNIIINRHYRYVNKHSILASVLVIISYSVFTGEDNSGVLC